MPPFSLTILNSPAQNWLRRSYRRHPSAVVVHVTDKCRDRDDGQDAEDGNDDHQLDQGEVV